MLKFTGCSLDDWGYIPSFLSENDPRPAREQINDNYQGGWHSMRGMTLNVSTLVMTYPGDPPYRSMGTLEFRNELIVLYPYSIVAIVQKDGTYEVARLD